MTKTVSATLKWVPPDEGGRQAPPSGSRYSTVSRFEQQGKTWENEAWSLVVDWTESPGASLTHRVNVHFLVEGGPEDLLVKGNRFELLEGRRVVATGEIL